VTKKSDYHQQLTRTYTKPNTRWLVHSWNTFGARTSHEQTRTHKIHHGPDLGEATTLPHIVYFVPFHEAHIQIAFCPRTLKWEFRNSQNWDSHDFGGPITLYADLKLRWGLKQSCSPRRELSNSISHITYTQGNWVDSRLLVVMSEIANLTPDLSFGHNLCFRCPNESFKPILDIYVSIAFQWYKKTSQSIGFWPLQLLSEHSGVHWDSNSQGGSSLGSVRVHSLTLFFTPRLPPLARNLVSPCLDREPKAKVTTTFISHQRGKWAIESLENVKDVMKRGQTSLRKKKNLEHTFNLIFK
jgi:hypothetical protein